jgi:hypothetical protein
VLFAKDAAIRHRDAVEAIRFGFSGGVLDTPAERAAIRAIQARVPPRAILITRLTKPYLLDFTRNTVLLNDWPGGASPPPGLPSFQGPEALSRYLTSVGVRYLAYSYRDEAGYPAASVTERLKPSTPEWIRNQTRYALDFQSAAKALGDLRARVADDGATLVVDLCTSTASMAVGRASICLAP